MKNLILITCCLTGLYLSAQEQVVIIDRNQARKQPNDAMPRRLVEHTQVFKFDPLRMMIGEINFAYERAVGYQSSVEFEIGPTVSNLGRNRIQLGGNMGEQYNRNPGMGVFISAAYRFYPLDGRPVFNQLYVSPKFKYRRYNETIDPEGMPELSEIRGNRNEAIFTFNFGYQQWLAKKFSFDYYVGFGLGSYNSVTYRPLSVYDGNTNTYNYSWQKESEMSARFIGTIGLKVGIGN